MSAPPRHAAPNGSADPADRTDRTVRITIILLFAAWLVDYADRLVINLVLPSLGEEFDLNRGQQGLVVSAFFLSYALCQIPGGILADRFGARRVTTWALLSWSLFTALTGFAWSFALLLLVRFAFGAAEGIFPPASMKLVVERTTPERRMSANGLIMSSNALAGVLTPLLAAPLIAAYGWRSAFFSTAALGVFVLVALRLWLPAPLPSTAPDAPEERHRIGDVLRKGVLWRFAGIMFGYNVIGWGLTTWAPSYLSEERGLPLSSAGPLLAIPALGAAVAVVVGGRLSDRLDGHHRKVIVPGMAVAAIALPFMAYSDSFVGFAVFGTLAIVAASLAYMPIFAVPMKGLPPAYVGVGSAVIIVGGQLAGMVTPPLMGVLADAFSFQVAFAFLVLGAVIAAVLAVLTPQDVDSFRAALGATGPKSPTDPNSPTPVTTEKS
ncbi:MFS transporter [Streptomyces sp. G-G2]|uniref:MFS transporter n=1 Tax=Streptomyces sp. G-G2 TaxID=3046201 RepID=UPI0024B93076|nr:MFS transporter [Streptomyces sp. G-G2]MDJ0384833.1 MFS transporter [Streptomyces sp. G-G2]